MAQIWDKVTKFLAAAGGALVGLLGGWSPLLTALCAFMGLDFVSGVVVAFRQRSQKTENGGVSSKAGFDGLIRKCGIIAAVFMGAILDRALDNDTAMFCMMVTCYFIANEGISICENLALLGVPIPPVLKRALEVVQKRSDIGDE